MPRSLGPGLIFIMSKKEKNYIGKFISNRKGFGFVSVEGMSEDFFIPEKYTLNAFNGDDVRISELKDSRGKRREAKVIKILGHETTEVVGTFERCGSFGFLIPDNPKVNRDIYIQGGDDMGAKTGDKAICFITDYGSANKGPSGRITEIIGDARDPYVDIYCLARAFGRDTAFSKEILEEADEKAKKITKWNKRGRLDLTKELVISIDGDDSKDLDDAISLKKDGDDYILGVHIADVSHYVTENSLTDREAYKRGTSVYLIDVVLPMLPEVLSNGMCSLLQNVERLTLSCIMRIDKRGRVISSEINNSFIINKGRMTYNKVNEILRNPKGETAKEYKHLTPMLFLMKELSGILNKARIKRGSIDFDIPEAKIKLNKSGSPISVEARDRGESERIIEEFMLICNETVAKTYSAMELPFLFRSHEAPDKDRILELRDLCNLFGVPLPGKKGKVTPKDIQKFLKVTKGTETEALMSTLALRTMQQAKYSDSDSFHFGLALEYYCHFTSPIRRYPDLLIHRIIKERLNKPFSKKKAAHFTGVVAEAAVHTSKQERVAAECEREVHKLKKCEYMLGRVGEEYDGIISGVTGWGIYVTLPNTVEGMVPIHSIGKDRYVFKEKTYEIIGERSGKVYRLGDKVKVSCDRVDLVGRTIDFRIVDKDNRLRHGKNR